MYVLTCVASVSRKVKCVSDRISRETKSVMYVLTGVRVVITQGDHNMVINLELSLGLYQSEDSSLSCFGYNA
jgi:vacuolar-type H+-ATPase catalytic subunit A/Vma1